MGAGWRPWEVKGSRASQRAPEQVLPVQIPVIGLNIEQTKKNARFTPDVCSQSAQNVLKNKSFKDVTSDTHVVSGNRGHARVRIYCQWASSDGSVFVVVASGDRDNAGLEDFMDSFPSSMSDEANVEFKEVL
jgi:hypothetical protein